MQTETQWSVPGARRSGVAEVLLRGGGFAVIAIAAILWAGCDNPRACEADSDCFEGQICKDSRCMDRNASEDATIGDGGETSSGDTGGSGADSGGDSGSGSGGDTGSSSGGDSGGSGSSGGDGGDYCTEGKCAYPDNHCDSADDISLNLGCVNTDDDGFTYEDVESVQGKRGCHCGENETRDGEPPYLDDIGFLIHQTQGDSCDQTYQDVGVKVTVEVRACGLENFDDVDLFLDSPASECPTRRPEDPQTELWCEVKPDQGEFIFHWRPTNSSDQNGTLKLGYDADRRFNYEVSAEIVRL